MHHLGRFLLTLVMLVLAAPSAMAQGIELTRADRLAILYTPQLQFSSTGEPLVKIGLVEGVQEIRFHASTPIRFRPLGDGGSEIEVPAETSIEVRIEEGQSGTYRYAVVVAELQPSERSSLNELRELWTERGFETSTMETGAIFAVSGQRFDTRRTLLVLGETDVRDDARSLARELSRQFGIESRVHAEMDEYPGGTIVVDGLPGGITIRNRDLMHIEGAEDTVFVVEDVPYDVGTRNEGSETRSYVGALYFTADNDGELALVAEMSIERLLEGIVPAEIYASAPQEALRAQAVAARSNLLTDLGARYTAYPYMTCADQRCQVYRGIEYEDSRTSRAVQDTRGRVLSDGDEIIKAYFSANNGGWSGSNSATWGEEERSYLTPHFDGPSNANRWPDGLSSEAAVADFLSNPPDAYSSIESFGSGRSFRWEETMSGEELSLAVAERYDLGPILSLAVAERDASGRVQRLRIEGTQGVETVERELNIRRTLGGLKSALFVMHIDSAPDGVIESVVFEGAGFGHGVGMCQSGAIGASERGMSYDEILENYYPETDLRELY